jgi:hypothetical protein
VLTHAPGFTLAEIHQAFPDGLDFRHVVWMMNRLLSALGYAQHNGIVHGAVLPEHLIYELGNHHLVLVDWCCSVSVGEGIRAIPEAHRNSYAPEVQRKRPCTTSMDLYMAALAFREVAKIPRRFQAIFEWCLAKSPSARPDDTLALKERWIQLAEEEYGLPKFVPLTMPTI